MKIMIQIEAIMCLPEKNHVFTTQSTLLAVTKDEWGALECKSMKNALYVLTVVW